MARFKSDGLIDSTFGIANNGYIMDDLISSPNLEFGQSIAIQSNGQILIGGSSGDPSDFAGYSYFMLARYFGFPPNPPPPTPINPICFPAGTPILTDQGKIPIEQIEPSINTISNKPIVAVTQTVTNEDRIVCIEKHAFGINIPNKKTYISCYHGIMYKNRLIPAKQFVGRFSGVHYSKYEGEKLYNILMEKHQIMIVNNMKVETLNPKNIVAKLYTSNYSNEQKTKIILEMNENSKKKIPHNYESKNGYETITGNHTRRRFAVFKYNPYISRLNFHTKKINLHNYNQYSHTIRHHNNYQKFKPTFRLTPYTFKNGRRRR